MKSRRATNTGHCAAESPEDLSLYDLLCRAPLCRIERKNGRCPWAYRRRKGWGSQAFWPCREGMEFRAEECQSAIGVNRLKAFWQQEANREIARQARSTSEPPRLNAATSTRTDRPRAVSHRGVNPVQVLLVAPKEAEEQENKETAEDRVEPESEPAPSPLRNSTTDNMAGYNEEWVDVQKNTFTRWANTYLSRKRMTIDDLYEDLKDGIRLISLLQIICREKVCRKFNKKPRMRIQKMENLNFAFAFMQKKNVNVTNIGSSDILDGNNKLVLGLMWTLIKAFQVAEIDVEGVSGKDGLLLWVNRSLADYPTVQLGRRYGFCALIHRYAPTLIDFNSLNPKDAQANVKLAFDIAREKFRIPQLLEVENVAGQAKPDEKSITTYVSLLFKEFASGVQKKKAVTTISKALNIAQRHQELAAEFNKNASGLLEWLQQQTSASRRSSKDVVAEVEEKAKQVEEAKAKAAELITPLTEDMEKLERIHEELERLQVHTNPFTTDTIHGLRAQFTSLETAVRDKVKSLEKELALSEVGSLTPQQAKEIKEVFDHFDLDNDGVLARDEFIMACKGLGLSLSEDDCHDYFDKIDVEDNDEITFDGFATFCTLQLQSGSTKDDVHEALDILTGDELTLEQIVERFDESQVEFIKKHLPELLEADGKSVDTEKFTDFIFSV
ncbi:EF-Hand 1, calcium-binding site [Phytophthora cactorum]|nr:EF-Hand 1, calcium-binding site [Phytophthora cactorum]